jgi:predicted DNA-binding protein (MmcQ/YjbR family)
MKWIQHYDDPGLSDDRLKEYLAESHRLAASNLTKKRQKALGLDR